MIRKKLGALMARYRRLRYEAASRLIVDTPPLEPNADGRYTMLSLVNHRDVFAYLVAAKTFAARLAPRRVILVADPTLTDKDQALLRTQVRSIEILDARDFRVTGLPVGGCWERLIAIGSVVPTDYTIQLDADTVTVDLIEDVQSAVMGNRAFMLASDDNLSVVDLDSAMRWARPRAVAIDHVQIQAEANFDALSPARWRYARGCAGFSGFPRGAFTVDMLHEVSRAMVSRIGERWQTWGSEQVMSNLICASQPDAMLLPHPKYCNADREVEGTAFLHFIGYVRFASSRYEDVTRAMIDRLSQPTPA